MKDFDEFNTIGCILNREAFIDDSIDTDIADIIRPYREDIMSENDVWGAICG